MSAMVLTREPGDRNLYRLGDVGTLRFHGFVSRGATAEAGGHSWDFGRRGFWKRGLGATDAAGIAVGEFVPRDVRRGGVLTWGGRELTLRPVSALRERYVVTEGDHELARVDGKGWGRRPVGVSLTGPGELEPELLLFTTFVVHRLAAQAAGSSSAGTAVSGTSC